MKYTIDRIEGSIAVCEDEDRNRVELPLEQLYENPREGDHFVMEDGVSRFDREATEQARQRILMLQRKLFEER